MQNPFKLLFLLAVAGLAFTSCGKSDDDDTQIKSGEVNYTVDGTATSLGSLNGSLTYSSDDTTQYLSIWADPADEDQYFIAIGMSHFTPFGADFGGEDVWNLFAPGAKSFAKESTQPNGAYVEWRAPDGTYFNSLLGDQTGSSFSITERSDYPGDFSFFFEAAGTFTCKVYDGNGNSHSITNGQWKGLVPLY